jgi:hypothetical protein
LWYTHAAHLEERAVRLMLGLDDGPELDLVQVRERLAGGVVDPVVGVLLGREALVLHPVRFMNGPV